MNEDQKAEESDYKYLLRILCSRTVDPAKHLPFIVYVVLGILLFGGLGIWIEILKIIISPKPSYEGLITASITFFPTLIGSTALQLVLASASRNDKILISFGLLVLCTFLACAILMPFFSVHHPVRVLVLSLICSLCAVWVWWITNGADSTFHKNPPANVATGGSLDRVLPGDASGYEL